MRRTVRVSLGGVAILWRPLVRSPEGSGRWRNRDRRRWNRVFRGACDSLCLSSWCRWSRRHRAGAERRPSGAPAGSADDAGAVADSAAPPTSPGQRPVAPPRRRRPADAAPTLPRRPCLRARAAAIATRVVPGIGTSAGYCRRGATTGGLGVHFGPGDPRDHRHRRHDRQGARPRGVVHAGTTAARSTGAPRPPSRRPSMRTAHPDEHLHRDRGQCLVHRLGALIDSYPDPDPAGTRFSRSAWAPQKCTTTAEHAKRYRRRRSLFGGYEWSIGPGWSLGLQEILLGATKSSLQDTSQNDTGYRMMPLSIGVQTLLLAY